MNRARIHLLLLSGLLVMGCGTARRGAPAIELGMITDRQVEHGQRVFNARCHQCHPGGTAGLGPALNNKPLPGWLIRFQVRHGLGAMPSFSPEEISDKDLDAVIQYLKWLRNMKPPSELGSLSE